VDEDEEEDDGGWEEHVGHAKRVLGGWKPTGRPPADLLDVLAKLAVAGPAVCALRALSRIVSVDDVESKVLLLDGAGRIAWALRSMFNRPESMAVIRETAGEGAFWKQVLEYSLDGGLTAVMDEYLHLVRDLVPCNSSSSPKSRALLRAGFVAAPRNITICLRRHASPAHKMTSSFRQ
jgi:hypothetical protein